LVLCGAGIMLMASANALLVALGALVIGLGYGAVTPSSSAILADRAPPNLRAFIFSLKQTGVPIGGAIAGALIPALIVMFGWRTAALVAGAACALLAFAFQPMRQGVDRGSRSPDHTHGSVLVEPMRLVLTHRGLREMAVGSFAYSGMQMCLGSFLVVFLHDQAGFSLSAAGAALSTAMAAGIGGRILWGVVADNWASPRRVLGALGIAMSAAAFAIAMVSPAWPMTAVFLVSFVYGATAVGWNGVYLSEVARIAPPGRAAAATGASLAMTYSGVVTLPLMFWGIVALIHSYAAAFVAVGSLSLWCGAVFVRRAGSRTVLTARAPQRHLTAEDAEDAE
jgi:MFS family permease